ncbi:MAG: hypothetical protein ACXADL_00130 [Candidatus Thorarchaeota archaeon]
MGVRERRKRKEKTKTPPKTDETKSTTVEKPIPEEREVTHKPEVIIKEKETTSSTELNEEVVTEPAVTLEVEEAIEFLVPIWGTTSDSEWMYHIPPRDEDKELWAEEWGDFLLQWTESKKVHVMSVATFIRDPPFNEMLGKVDAFRLIGNSLEVKEVAKWLDRKKRQLRVYWRPLEEWADIVYQWAIKTGKLSLDVKSIVIQEGEESFATLPEKDILIVLSIMVEKGLAEWVDKKKGAITISV